MKKPTLAILALLGGLLVIAFLAWAFSQHGTIGLFRVNEPVRWIFLVFGFIGLVLLVLAGLLQVLKSGGRRWLTVLTIIISLPAIIVPCVAFSYTGGIYSAGIGDTMPQVYIADGTGSHGVPNVAVVFNTEAATRNTIYWGLGEVVTKIEEPRSSRQHVFMLRDLVPDCVYVYRVNDGPLFSFTTPGNSGSLHFAVGSDTHFGSGKTRTDYIDEMLDDIASPSNDFDLFFFLGDLVEYGFRTEQWRQAFEAFANTTSTIPIRYAAGNHDTLFSGFKNYQEYCYPEEVDLQNGSRLWYRINVGTIHFLVLDLEWSAESFTSAQEEWLETQLQSIPDNDWKIVMSHGFYYSSGLETGGWKWYDNPETIEKLTPLFNCYGVDLVFSGHNHRLELLENKGVVYAVAAPFGGSPDESATYKSPSSIWDGTGERGFVDVTIDGEECTIVFRNHEFKSLKTYVFTRD